MSWLAFVSNEVSTGSDSDRVSTHAPVEICKTVNRSLPLPVLTPSSSEAVRVSI